MVPFEENERTTALVVKLIQEKRPLRPGSTFLKDGLVSSLLLQTLKIKQRLRAQKEEKL